MSPLSDVERYRIAALRRAGYSPAAIGLKIGRGHTTVRRTLARMDAVQPTRAAPSYWSIVAELAEMRARLAALEARQ